MLLFYLHFLFILDQYFKVFRKSRHTGCRKILDYGKYSNSKHLDGVKITQSV